MNRKTEEGCYRLCGHCSRFCQCVWEKREKKFVFLVCRCFGVLRKIRVQKKERGEAVKGGWLSEILIRWDETNRNSVCGKKRKGEFTVFLPGSLTRRFRKRLPMPLFLRYNKMSMYIRFKLYEVFMKGSEDMDNGPTPVRKRILLMILKPSLASQDR